MTPDHDRSASGDPQRREVGAHVGHRGAGAVGIPFAAARADRAARARDDPRRRVWRGHPDRMAGRRACRRHPSRASSCGPMRGPSSPGATRASPCTPGICTDCPSTTTRSTSSWRSRCSSISNGLRTRCASWGVSPPRRGGHRPLGAVLPGREPRAGPARRAAGLDPGPSEHLGAPRVLGDRRAARCPERAGSGSSRGRAPCATTGR